MNILGFGPVPEPDVEPGDLVSFVDATPDGSFGGGIRRMIVATVGRDEDGNLTFTGWDDPEGRKPRP